MIFQKLHAFARQRGLLDDLDFVGQTIHGVFSLRVDGTLAGAPLPLGEKKKPFVKSTAKLPARNSAAIAGLGADTLGRIVPGFDPAANAFARRTQQLFLEQMAAINAAQAQPHPGLTAIVAFLQSLAASTEVAEAVSAELRKAKLLPTDWVTFQVSGQEALCIEWPVVQTWWREQQTLRRAERAISGKDAAICMVTGLPCLPQLTHGTRIKGIPGGRSGGVALVSGAGSAFNSYGFEKSLTSPMSEEAVEGYIRAVGFMVDHRDYHYRTGEVIHLFFGDEPNRADNPGAVLQSGGIVSVPVNGADAQGDTGPVMIEIGADWLDTPTDRDEHSSDPAVAGKVFQGPYAGALDEAHAEDAMRFYSLSLSGNSARAIVRGWLDQTLTQARKHVREWFEDLEIRLDRPLFKDDTRFAERGTLYRRWPLWQLVNTLQGQGESAKEQIVKEQQLLWECALAGRHHPMPLDLLLRAVARIGSSGEFPPVRAALIRCVLNRLRPIHQNHFMKKDLDLQSHSCAYQCGRLVRVLTRIQVSALRDSDTNDAKKREINAGVIEKYYSAASAMPGNVLGPLIAKAQHHLAKIENRPDRGAKIANSYRRTLREICTTIVKLGGFPQTNNPVQQGEFALGFYFQEARAPKETTATPAASPVSETVTV